MIACVLTMQHLTPVNRIKLVSNGPMIDTTVQFGTVEPLPFDFFQGKATLARKAFLQTFCILVEATDSSPLLFGKAARLSCLANLKRQLTNNYWSTSNGRQRKFSPRKWAAKLLLFEVAHFCISLNWLGFEMTRYVTFRYVDLLYGKQQRMNRPSKLEKKPEKYP